MRYVVKMLDHDDYELHSTDDDGENKRIIRDFKHNTPVIDIAVQFDENQVSIDEVRRSLNHFAKNLPSSTHLNKS